MSVAEEFDTDNFQEGGSDTDSTQTDNDIPIAEPERHPPCECRARAPRFFPDSV